MLQSKNNFVFKLSIIIFSICVVSNNGHVNKHTHQLFRENLLPNLGGKIPETAFQPERISLNRLNQNGLYSPDGIYIEQGEANTVHHGHQLRKTIKVKAAHQNVRGLVEGKHVVDTTYVIRDPVLINLMPTNKRYFPTIPISSLKLLSFYKRRHRENNPSSLEKNIFNELVPYLRKLHEYD